MGSEPPNRGAESFGEVESLLMENDTEGDGCTNSCED